MNLSTEKIEFSCQVPGALAGKRLDQVASRLMPEHSRSRLQGWIKTGELTVDGERARAKDRLAGGEFLALSAMPEASDAWRAQDIALDIVFEDDSILIINKPAGLVVHPAAGNRDGTLLNGLLNHLPQPETVPRAGIVHRLDKDTSGLMVVAKTLQARASLARQLQDRAVSRGYEAVACGAMTGGGAVTANIGRHPAARTKMAVLQHGGKAAATHYRVLRRFGRHTHIRVRLETGRTHQIRVHMAHIGHPLVGDRVYGGRLQLPKGASGELVDTLRNFKRQALHAASLGLVHPRSGRAVSWRIPLPADMQRLLAVLQSDDVRQGTSE